MMKQKVMIQMNLVYFLYLCLVLLLYLDLLVLIIIIISVQVNMENINTLLTNYNNIHLSECYIADSITKTQFQDFKTYYRIRWINQEQQPNFKTWENEHVHNYILDKPGLDKCQSVIDIDFQTTTKINRFSMLAMYQGEYYALVIQTTSDKYQNVKDKLKTKMAEFIKRSEGMNLKRFKIKLKKEVLEDFIVQIHKVPVQTHDLPFQQKIHAKRKHFPSKTKYLNKRNKVSHFITQIARQMKVKLEQNHPLSSQSQLIEEIQGNNSQKHVVIIENSEENEGTNNKIQSLSSEVKIEEEQIAFTKPNSLLSTLHGQDLKSQMIEQNQKNQQKHTCDELPTSNYSNDQMETIKKASRSKYGFLDNFNIPEYVKQSLSISPLIKITKHRLQLQDKWSLRVQNLTNVFWLPQDVLCQIGYTDEVKQYKDLVKFYEQIEKICQENDL